MHKPWPFINTFLKRYNIIYTQIFGGIFFFIVNTVKKKVKTIKCSFYEFIHKKILLIQVYLNFFKIIIKVIKMDDVET